MLRGWLVLLLLAFIGPANAAYLTPTTSGNLMLQYLWGEAGPSHQELGLYEPSTGETRMALQIDYTKPVQPIASANMGYHWAGVGIDFYERSDYMGELTAFSNGVTQSALTAFRDVDNSIGGAIEVIGANDWVLHLDDAWSFWFDDDDNDLVVRVWIDTTAPAPVSEPGAVALILVGFVSMLQGLRKLDAKRCKNYLHFGTDRHGI